MESREYVVDQIISLFNLPSFKGYTYDEQVRNIDIIVNSALTSSVGISREEVLDLFKSSNKVSELLQLGKDPLFKVIEHLDHISAVNLCSTDVKFKAFCAVNRDRIWMYFISRDFPSTFKAVTDYRNNPKNLIDDRYPRIDWKGYYMYLDSFVSVPFYSNEGFNITRNNLTPIDISIFQYHATDWILREDRNDSRITYLYPAYEGDVNPTNMIRLNVHQLRPTIDYIPWDETILGQFIWPSNPKKTFTGVIWSDDYKRYRFRYDFENVQFTVKTNTPNPISRVIEGFPDDY